MSGARKTDAPGTARCRGRAHGISRDATPPRPPDWGCRCNSSSTERASSQAPTVSSDGLRSKPLVLHPALLGERLERRFLLGREVLRNLDVHLDVLIAPPPVPLDALSLV